MFPEDDKLQLLPGLQLGHTKQYFLEPTETEPCSRSHCWQWQLSKGESCHAQTLGNRLGNVTRLIMDMTRDSTEDLEVQLFSQISSFHS